MSDTNAAWHLARQPASGLPVADDYQWREGVVPECGPEQVLARTLYLSLDPYQWVRRRGGVESPGDVCHGRTVAQVIRSRHPDYAEGDYLFNTLGWQQAGLTGDGISTFGYMLPRRLDPTLAPISTALGIMGMLGLTAYAGLIVQCRPLAGETVVVSAASGGVGQVVVQLARIAGARVVGIEGGSRKCEFVRSQLRADACVDYRSDDFAGELATACPDGVDVYFETVGGAVFTALLPLLNQRARVSLCGLISQYANADNEGKDARTLWREQGSGVFERQAVAVHDLFVGNFVEEHQSEFLEKMSHWLHAGEVHYQQDMWAGLERAPEAYLAMLTGENFGKTLVAVADDPTAGATSLPISTRYR